MDTRTKEILDELMSLSMFEGTAGGSFFPLTILQMKIQELKEHLKSIEEAPTEAEELVTITRLMLVEGIVARIYETFPFIQFTGFGFNDAPHITKYALILSIGISGETDLKVFVNTRPRTQDEADVLIENLYTQIVRFIQRM